jgi:hypothetical protein
VRPSSAAAAFVALVATALAAARADALDLAIAYCKARGIVTLGRGNEADAAEAAAIRACIAKGGTRDCCKFEIRTYPNIARNRGRTLCLVAVRGPHDVIAIGGGASINEAIIRASYSCESELGDQGFPVECKPIKVLLSGCRPPPPKG